MKIFKMPKGKHQCLLYSRAMALNEYPKDLIQEIGHDGLSKWWDKPEPECYRSHHIQEFILPLLRRDKCLVPIELYPCSIPLNGLPGDERLLWDQDSCSERFRAIIDGRVGILIGMSGSGIGHACAWSGEKVYDPNGRIYGIENFIVKECWLIFEINKE